MTAHDTIQTVDFFCNSPSCSSQEENYISTGKKYKYQNTIMCFLHHSSSKLYNPQLFNPPEQYLLPNYIFFTSLLTCQWTFFCAVSNVKIFCIICIAGKQYKMRKVLAIYLYVLQYINSKVNNSHEIGDLMNLSFKVEVCQIYVAWMYMTVSS